MKVTQGCFPWAAAFLFLWSSPVGNELKWRRSEEAQGKHPVLHTPWSCTACVDAIGSNPFWLWELRPKFQHGNHGKQERRPPLAHAPPPGQKQLGLCHSHPFPTRFAQSLVMQILWHPQEICCTASLQLQPKDCLCFLDFPCCSWCFSSDVPSPIWSSATPPALGPKVSSLGRKGGAAHLFTTGQHETQPAIQFSPFSPVSLIISTLL